MVVPEINRMISPHNFNAGQASRIKYIVIHYVGALGGAEANCRYYMASDRGASAHYFFGHNGEIWKSVEDATVKSTQELTKYLMQKYNVPAERVIRHHDVTCKKCPAPYVDNNTNHTWDSFKAGLR